jgi:hypothetical protein
LALCNLFLKQKSTEKKEKKNVIQEKKWGMYRKGRKKKKSERSKDRLAIGKAFLIYREIKYGKP